MEQPRGTIFEVELDESESKARERVVRSIAEMLQYKAASVATL